MRGAVPRGEPRRGANVAAEAEPSRTLLTHIRTRTHAHTHARTHARARTRAHTHTHTHLSSPSRTFKTPGNAFDIIFVCDCVHFVDFHAALLCTLGRTLSTTGVAVLVQPRRERSLEKFTAMLDAVSDAFLYDLSTPETADPAIHSRHVALLAAEDDTYDPNLHMPLYLSVRKRREWMEDVDGDRVRRRGEEEKGERVKERRERLAAAK